MPDKHIRKPCDHPDCRFYEETEIDYKISLAVQSLPQVFGISSNVCLACCRFKKFDMLETEAMKRRPLLNAPS